MNPAKKLLLSGIVLCALSLGTHYLLEYFLGPRNLITSPVANASLKFYRENLFIIDKTIDGVEFRKSILTGETLAIIDDSRYEDPLDYDPEYDDFMQAVDIEVRKRIRPRDGMGWCFSYWAAKKRLLKSEYGIDWRSPAELNPWIIFD